MSISVWRPPAGEHCGGCSRPITRIWRYEEAPPVGDMIVCMDCAAVHVVEADGIRFTGKFAHDFVRHETSRIVAEGGDFSG